MTWGEDVARQRIRRCAAHGGIWLKLNDLDLASVPEEVRVLCRLERLDLSNNLLEDLPGWLGELDCLTDLEVGGNGLTVLPPWIGGLPHLTHLCLYDNLLTELPEWLATLTGLVRLHLGANDFAQLPDWIGDLSDLRDLKLQDLRMRSLPVWISRLGKLNSLDVSANELTELPSWIGTLDRLTHLRLSRNQLSSLPPETARLSRLEDLDVGSNYLAELPSWATKLPSLRRLAIGGNSLAELPESLASMTRLRSLDVGSNSISVLPDALASLKSLSDLFLYNNPLTDIPAWIGELRKLRQLDLDRCNLPEVPQWLRKLTSLRHLALNGNQISELPDWLGELSRLQNIWITDNQLEALPDSMSRLTKLAGLYISVNKLGVLPDWIGDFRKLRSLDASATGLRDLPESISRLKRLTELLLTENGFTEVPLPVRHLKRLRFLALNSNYLTYTSNALLDLPRLCGIWLDGNEFSSPPHWLANLVAIRQLSIDIEEMETLPEWVGELRRLQSLYISKGSVSRLPHWIGGLPKLEVLHLSSNRLSHLPESITALTRLRRFMVEGNELTRIPAWIGSLARLEDLGVAGNKISELPDSIANVRSLKRLRLSRNHLTDLSAKVRLPDSLRLLSLDQNKLTALPAAVSKLTHLTSLDAHGNDIAEAPAWIANLTQLTDLDLSANRLTGLPDSISALTRLRKLRVNGNSLIELPPTLAELHRLREVYLHNNGLSVLPEYLLGFDDLRELSVHDNELLSPPPEVVAGGTQSTLEFLTARMHGSLKQWRSKMVVVGEGGVGKTSMIKNLLDLPFDPAESTTHGMRVLDYRIPHPQHHDVSMLLATWDFGGQEIYHATHQFFLTDRSLFLLLWNSRLGWRQGRLRYWLDIIAARAPESPILLVATNAPADGRPVDLPLGDLQREYPSILTNVAIDNETGHGLDALRGQIAFQATQLPLMGAEWPDTWLAAANALRDVPGTHVAPIQLWRAMGAEGGLTYERHQRYVARALHHLGDILYDQDNPKLADTVILHPEWVNTYICRVLDSPEVERCHGLLRREHLDTLWSDLDRGMRDYLLALMEEYDLSYKVDGGHDTDLSLVVERLPWSAPPYQAAWGGIGEEEYEIRVLYQLNTTPPGIPTWFIARSHRFSTTTHWRTGALLTHPDGRHRALIHSDVDRNTVELAVRGPSPASFFAVLDDGLNVTLARYPGLSVRRFVPCPCADPDEEPCNEQYDFEDLARRLRRVPPRHEIECRKSGRDVYVPLLLLGLAPSGNELLRGGLDRLTAMVTQNQAALVDRLDDLGGDLQRQFLKIQQQIQAGLETPCPSVFTITPVRVSKVRGETYRLSLYCEEPGAWHPLPDDGGSYTISEQPTWLRRFGPYLRELLAILKHATPLIGPILGVTAEKLNEHIKADVGLMDGVVDQLTAIHIPSSQNSSQNRLDSLSRRSGSADNAPAEYATSEADFRALRALLERIDPAQRWGGLSRIATPEGLTVYLCPHHAAPYEHD